MKVLKALPVAAAIALVGWSLSAEATILIETVDNLQANGISGLDGDRDGTPDEEDGADDGSNVLPEDPDDLVFKNNSEIKPENNDGVGVDEINSALQFGGGSLFPEGVNYLFKADGIGGANDGNGDLPFSNLETSQFLADNPGIDLGIELTCLSGGCTELEWTLTGASVDIWNIVKIGVKAGPFLAYFLIDPFDTEGSAGQGADTGIFDIDDWDDTATCFFRVGNCGDIQGGRGPDAGTIKIGNIPGFSHIEFFGTQLPPPPELPEPLTLTLLGAGLIGLGALRRRIAA